MKKYNSWTNWKNWISKKEYKNAKKKGWIK